MGTSYVAAGMLAPVAEVEFGEAGQAALELGLRSAEMWPEFAAELERASGDGGGIAEDGHARARPRRGRGARARAPDRLPRIARAAHDSPARERGPRRASRRSRRPCAWRWKRPRITRSIRAWCSSRCAGPVRRRGAAARARAGGPHRVRSGASARVTGVALAGRRAHCRAPRWCSPPAPGARQIDGSAGARDACPCARSRVSSCACAIPPVRGCWSAWCASRAATWFPARMVAMCWAPLSRSAASKSTPPRVGCTSCCARRTSSCRA